MRDEKRAVAYRAVLLLVMAAILTRSQSCCRMLLLWTSRGRRSLSMASSGGLG